MANFKTHVGVAAVGSGLVASALLGAGLVSPGEAVALWACGAAGGMLPDIDADRSDAADTIFTGLGLSLALAVMVGLAGIRSTLEIWLASVAVYVAVRYGVIRIFYRFTHHRGIFHSLVAGVFFWLVATAVCAHVLDLEAALSWGLGTFIFLGFVVHLFLDEFYSVDITNAQLESSFGTALKLFDYRNLKTSGMMAIAVVAMFFVTPSLSGFVDIALARETYQNIVQNLIP